MNVYTVIPMYYEQMREKVKATSHFHAVRVFIEQSSYLLDYGREDFKVIGEHSTKVFKTLLTIEELVQS